MAIKNVVANGLFFNGGVIAFAFTDGLGAYTAGGGGGGGGVVDSQQTQWGQPIQTWSTPEWATSRWGEPFEITRP